MSETLFHSVKHFLEKAHVDNILLGWSGGADSTALLHLLLECQSLLPFKMTLAHIDHSWREESQKEAKDLKEKAKEMNIPFYLHVLPKPVSFTNIEMKCREERLHFFSSLYKKIGADALLLAHHKGDEAETVFKRMVEGAHLTGFVGIEKESLLRGMRVLRPLLSHFKNEILSYINKRRISFFEDQTNHSTQFLRGRMRQELFPFIEKSFGKGIQSNLARLGEESRELKTYLDKKIEGYFQKIEKGPFGFFIDLSSLGEPFEWCYFLKRWSASLDLSISYSKLQEMKKALIENSANKKFLFKKGLFFIDRKRVFFLSLPLPSFKGGFSVKEGSVFESKGYRLKLSFIGKGNQTSSWQDFFKGGGFVALPPCSKGSFSEEEVKGSFDKKWRTKQLRKRWSDSKAPHILWDLFPIFYVREKVINDCLSIKRGGIESGYQLWHLFIERIDS